MFIRGKMERPRENIKDRKDSNFVDENIFEAYASP